MCGIHIKASNIIAILVAENLSATFFRVNCLLSNCIYVVMVHSNGVSDYQQKGIFMTTDRISIQQLPTPPIPQSVWCPSMSNWQSPDGQHQANKEPLSRGVWGVDLLHQQDQCQNSNWTPPGQPREFRELSASLSVNISTNSPRLFRELYVN